MPFSIYEYKIDKLKTLKIVMGLVYIDIVIKIFVDE